jgi:hypothetical protein
MLSIMQIDGIAKRYGKLPSEVLKDANTFYLYVLDASLTYEHYHHKKAMNKGQEPIENYSNDQLLNMFNKGKENNGPRNAETSKK